MSWHINCVTNEITISLSVAKKLLTCGAEDSYGWEDVSDVRCEESGKLHFQYDHMEHMDFLEYKEVQEVLKQAKAKGDVCFSSNDGDNSGTSWGYRFDGKGGMTELVGSQTFLEVQPKTPTQKNRKRSKKLTSGKGELVCAACYDESRPKARNQIGKRPGTSVSSVGSHEPYCYDCGESHSLKLV